MSGLDTKEVATPAEVRRAKKIKQIGCQTRPKALTEPKDILGAVSTRQLSIYDGRERIGMVIEGGARCDAFDVAGVYIGSFNKLKAATDAVVLSRSSSCVPDTNGRRDNSG